MKARHLDCLPIIPLDEFIGNAFTGTAPNLGHELIKGKNRSNRDCVRYTVNRAAS